jgi:hypothetical protein
VPGEPGTSYRGVLRMYEGGASSIGYVSIGALLFERFRIVRVSVPIYLYLYYFSIGAYPNVPAEAVGLVTVWRGITE